jgi:arabinofuranosyltransferase
MNTFAETAARAPRRPFVFGLGAAAVLWGVSAACRDAWTCDDAYIVFRYARNLVNGLGLVFNAGERVEGFTDLLWVLFTTPAFVLGIAPETWANAWGIACYGAVIALLGFDHARLVRRVPSSAWAVLPVAALAAAAHSDWSVWATSGLETSAFTFFLVAGYVLLVGPRSSGRLAAAGLVFGLASLLRPDGVLPALVGGTFVIAMTRAVKPAAAYAAGFTTLWLPAAVFRLSYYRSMVPNTYWAKSANLAWWGQGFRYLGLYFEKYGVLALGPALLLLVALRWRHEDAACRELLKASWLPRVWLAGALAVTYTLYVARVGGDFMYARMLIPATPFLLILFELGFSALPARIPFVAILGLAAAPAVIPTWIPRPVTGSYFVRGVADEFEFYDLRRTSEVDFRGFVLKRFFDGLPVRALIFGAEVRMVYRAEVPVVVDGDGLTDRHIARQPLMRRGRPGHERLPDPAYAVLERKIHVVFSQPYYLLAGFPAFIPIVPIRFGPVGGFLLHWDPVMMEAWKRRGAVFEDFPAWLDGYVRRMPSASDETVRNDYERFRHFYFQNVEDKERERPFRARLGLP